VSTAQLSPETRLSGTPVVPGSARAWLLASRPATLTAAFTPVFVGTACAVRESALSFGPALASLLGAFLLQIGCNFANDVFDYEKGADTAARLGPERAVQSGLLTPVQVRRGMWLVFGLALALGVYLTSVAGLTVVVIGLASIAAAIGYTGGPYPLGYHGFGDVFVFFFFGFVAVCGTTFVQAGFVPAMSWYASLPVGALATAVLVVNNVRDRETDVLAGKRTLPVRLGRCFGEVEYGALLAAAYVVPVALVGTGRAEWSVALPCLTLPLAAKRFQELRTRSGKALNATLGGTARLLLFYGVLFGVGILATGR
jgi:1,4-dihydroxy-2-naphthoate octaprenyltransferase